MCQPWNKNYPYYHSYKKMKDDIHEGKHNYCRNPGGKKERPWCFTTLGPGYPAWEYCDLKFCNEKMVISWKHNNYLRCKNMVDKAEEKNCKKDILKYFAPLAIGEGVNFSKLYFSHCFSPLKVCIWIIHISIVVVVSVKLKSKTVLTLFVRE